MQSKTAVDVRKLFGQEQQYSNFYNVNYFVFFLMKSIAERWYENWYLSLQEIRLPTKKSYKIILTNFTYFLKRLGETTGYENCTIKSYELFVIFYLINIITSDSIP